MRNSEHGVEHGRFRIESERLLPAAPVLNMSMRSIWTAVVSQPLYPKVPRFDIGRRRVAQTRLLALGQLDLHFGGENQRNLILHRKDVVDGAIEAFRPDMYAGRRLDQLRRDPNSVRRLADAPFEHITNTELMGDLAHIHRASLVSETRIAGDNG